MPNWKWSAKAPKNPLKYLYQISVLNMVFYTRKDWDTVLCGLEVQEALISKLSLCDKGNMDFVTVEPLNGVELYQPNVTNGNFSLYLHPNSDCWSNYPTPLITNYIYSSIWIWKSTTSMCPLNRQLLNICLALWKYNPIYKSTSPISTKWVFNIPHAYSVLKNTIKNETPE